MGFGIAHRDPVLFDHAIRPDQGRRADRSFNRFSLGVLPRSPGTIDFHDAQLRIR